MDYDYHVELITLDEDIPIESTQHNSKEKAEQVVAKLKGAFDIIITELAAAQDQMEQTANPQRNIVPKYKVGDLV